MLCPQFTFISQEILPKVHMNPTIPVVGVLDEALDEPYSAQPAQVSSRTCPPIYRRLEPCPSYVAWRAGMATLLSGLSWVGFV